jgi:hypothetical protein
MVANDQLAGSLLKREQEMVELGLLLPGWQVEALERVADKEGLTIGQMLRRLVNKAITQSSERARQQSLFPDNH